MDRIPFLQSYMPRNDEPSMRQTVDLYQQIAGLRDKPDPVLDAAVIREIYIKARLDHLGAVFHRRIKGLELDRSDATAFKASVAYAHLAVADELEAEDRDILAKAGIPTNDEGVGTTRRWIYEEADRLGLETLVSDERPAVDRWVKEEMLKARSAQLGLE